MNRKDRILARVAAVALIVMGTYETIEYFKIETLLP
jgi:hypothetical protein